MPDRLPAVDQLPRQPAVFGERPAQVDRGDPGFADDRLAGDNGPGSGRQRTSAAGGPQSTPEGATCPNGDPGSLGPGAGVAEDGPTLLS